MARRTCRSPPSVPPQAPLKDSLFRFNRLQKIKYLARWLDQPDATNHWDCQNRSRLGRERFAVKCYGNILALTLRDDTKKCRLPSISQHASLSDSTRDMHYWSTAVAGIQVRIDHERFFLAG